MEDFSVSPTLSFCNSAFQISKINHKKKNRAYSSYVSALYLYLNYNETNKCPNSYVFCRGPGGIPEVAGHCLCISLDY